jgi:hypothetical protein
VTPSERVREIQDYYRFDLSLLESVDRLLGQSGLWKPPLPTLSDGYANNDTLSFAANLRGWLDYKHKQDLVPERVQEMAARIGWPEEMRLRVAGGAVDSSELWARAFAADLSHDSGWAILLSEGLFGFFKDVVNLIISGVHFANGVMQVDQKPSQDDTKELAKLLGGYLETGTPSLAIRPTLTEDQLGFCKPIFEAGVEFVIFHELMHVMQGHHEAAQGRAVRTTLLQEAVHNQREEFEADRLGFGFLLRTWPGRRAIAFAGTSLLLQALMLLERYPSQLLGRRSHPPAAERLLRLRADAPKIFLALQHKFDDVRSLENAFSHRLQLIADELPQESAPIVSPWNDLFAECADIGTTEIPEPLQLRFLFRVTLWMVMGDLQVTCATLGELWGDAESALHALKDLGPNADQDDLVFRANACALVARLVGWLRDLGSAGERPLRIIESAHDTGLSRLRVAPPTMPSSCHKASNEE